MEVRVQASDQTAMFAWSDSRADEIKRIFGHGLKDGEEADTAAILDLMVNKELLEDHARGLAAQIYSTMQDQATGQLTTPGLRWDAKPTGSLRMIQFVAGPDMRSTVLTFPETRLAAPLAELLDDGTRKAIFRLVQRD